MSFSALLEFLKGNSLGRSIVVLLGVAFFALLATNIGTYAMISATRNDTAWVEHTYQVRRLIMGLSNASLEAESAGRGYVITGRQTFLDERSGAIGRAEILIDALDKQTRDNADQQRRLHLLRALFKARFEAQDEVIEARRRGDEAAVGRLMRAGRTTGLSIELRRLLSEIDRSEERLLRDRQEQTRRSAGVSALVNTVGGLLILVAAATSILLFRRSLRAVQASRDEVERLNTGLEQTVRDRTDDLVRANAEIQRFAYIVSHDLRAPLVNVMGYTSELQAAGQALERQIEAIEAGAPALADAEAVRAIREDVPEAIGFIRASTAKMDSLINAILRLSREGRRNLSVEKIDMNQAVAAMTDAVNHQVQEVGAVIKLAPLPTLESDRVGIEQVFGNLVDNAIKYLDRSRKGEISIWGRDLGNGYVEYAVSDNGRGIAPRDHERVFELFRRAGVQDRAGEGLGLAFVKNTVLRLGGSITVESELGKGSTFRVRLPKRLIAELGEAA